MTIEDFKPGDLVRCVRIIDAWDWLLGKQGIVEEIEIRGVKHRISVRLTEGDAVVGFSPEELEKEK